MKKGQNKRVVEVSRPPKAFYYARVSSTDQNLARQLIQAEGLDPDIEIFADKASGKNFNRQQYTFMKTQLREGDTLYMASLDRFGRNYEEIIDEWKDISQNIGADIVILDMPLLDTRQNKELLGTLITDIILALLAYVAENERNKIKSRQREGLDAMKAQGRWDEMGRPKKQVDEELFKKIFKKQKAGELTVEEAARELGVSRSWYYANSKRLTA